MKNEVVSIVIPIFNNQNYISECIESVLSQTYRFIEVILIDDGSTDKSGTICDKYAAIDNRIKVVHQKNKGVSAARNIGIQNSSGKYIQFVDSDDKIKSNMTEILFNGIFNNDICICGYDYVYMKRRGLKCLNKCPEDARYNFDEFVVDFGKLFYGGFINSPCNKMYDLDIIKSNKICFKWELNMGEDLVFNLDYFNKCTKIRVINDSLYVYLNYRENTLSKKFDINLFNNHITLFDFVSNFLENNKIKENQNDLYVVRVFVDRTKNIIEQINHKDNSLNIKKQFLFIKNIVINEEVNMYFNILINSKNSISLIDYLVYIKSSISILLFYKIKQIIKKIIFSLIPIYDSLFK